MVELTDFLSLYFHFCLLALFRPFIHHALDVAGTTPRTVCAEAVQAILDLTQSYASMFTLGRTPCLVPYFVFAAGLTRILLEGDSAAVSSLSPFSASGSSPATVHTGTGSPYQSVSFDDGGDASMTGTDSAQASLSPTSTMMSMSHRSSSATTRSSVSEDDRGMTQAVRQLEEMSVGHPAAGQAGWVLRDFNPHHQDHR